MVFHWILRDSKSPQVSRTLLSILAVLSNVVIWIVSTRPPTSKSSMHFKYPLVIVSKAPITIGTIVTFMFNSIFNPPARSRYLSFFSHSFSFIQWLAGTAKSTILQILFFVPMAGRPARTYIQQLCEDTGCSPEDLSEAMNDREKWWERIRDIRASGATWWWWWL